MKIQSKTLPYFLLFPALVLVCIFKIYPIVSCLFNGFTYNGEVSLETYRRLFADSDFWNSLWITIKFNLIVIPLQVCISLALALLCNKALRGIGVFRTILYLPYSVSLTVAVMIWSLMFNYNSGVINSFLTFLGFSAQGFLNDKNQALMCIIIIATWKGCGYWMMFFVAGLKNIDPSIYEAAKIDGANWLQSTFSMTIPLLKSVILFVCVANTTSNVLLFAPMQLVTKGGPRGSTDVLMYEAYMSVFKYADPARGSAIVTVLLLIIVTVALFQFKFLGKKDD